MTVTLALFYDQRDTVILGRQVYLTLSYVSPLVRQTGRERKLFLTTP